MLIITISKQVLEQTASL